MKIFKVIMPKEYFHCFTQVLADPFNWESIERIHNFALTTLEYHFE